MRAYDVRREDVGDMILQGGRPTFYTPHRAACGPWTRTAGAWTPPGSCS